MGSEMCIRDSAYDLYDNYSRYGYVMFPQQVAIYRYLAECFGSERWLHGSILEAGCGNGVGSALIHHRTGTLIATDVSESNVRFCKCLYPWIDFRLWDIKRASVLKADHVVAVEVLEHIEEPQLALRNLIDAAYKTIWLSTPNGTDKRRPPENTCHVCEYTPAEVLAMIHQCWKGLDVEIIGYGGQRLLSVDTDVDPLIYRIKK